MTRILVVAAIGIFLSFKLEAKKIKGKIITQNDTIDVVFNIPVSYVTQQPNYQRIQYNVRYTDTTGKKSILYAGEIKEYQFEFDGKLERMLSRPNSLGSIFSSYSYVFLRLVIDGKVQMFDHYYTQTSPGAYGAGPGGGFGVAYSYTVENYIIQKGPNGELKRPKGLNFKKDMIEYFSDCPELVNRIENKVFAKDDLHGIVTFYNQNCVK